MQQFITNGFKLDVSETQILTIIYNLLCAVKYLHDCRLVHRDLKSSNILVNYECNVRICDFGHARALTFGPDKHHKLL